jgi:FdrA protein
MLAEQRYIRGLFSGGTFCYQAQHILRDMGIVVHSNTPLQGNPPLEGLFRSKGHTLVDMGADEFTVGRPHPMMDPALRNGRILAEAEDPHTAVLLLDFILGFNAPPDPAAAAVPVILEARRKMERRGGHLVVAASVCGTAEDPQGLALQVRSLEDAGVLVFSTGARAARFCGLLAAVGLEVPRE